MEVEEREDEDEEEDRTVNAWALEGVVAQEEEEYVDWRGVGSACLLVARKTSLIQGLHTERQGVEPKTVDKTWWLCVLSQPNVVDRMGDGCQLCGVYVGGPCALCSQ